jgi:RHS repeat-associated protein
VTQTYNVDDGDKLNSIVSGSTTLKSYAYDAAGRTTGVTTSSGTTSMTYDYEDRITQISLPGSVTDTFTYNGLDTRATKGDSTGNYSFVRDGADVTDPVLEDGAANYTPAVSRHTTSGTVFDNLNYIGTSTRQTNSSQTTTATRTYDAFGNLFASTGTPVGPFGFVGKGGYQQDSDSGLKLLGHRYYDPSTGRFLTRDPAQDGRNWYVYCNNNPTASADPSGLIPAWLQSIGKSVGGFVKSVGNFLKPVGTFLSDPIVKMVGAGLGLLGALGLLAKHAIGVHGPQPAPPPYMNTGLGTDGASGWQSNPTPPPAPSLGSSGRSAKSQQWWLDPDK